MHNPDLPASCFLLDEVLDERVLYQPAPGSVHTGDHPLRIALPPGIAPLAHFDGLRLTVENRSGSPVNVGLRLRHAGGAVSVTGDRQALPDGRVTSVFFPAECFGLIGRATGWQDVEGIDIVVCRPKDAARPAAIEVCLRSLVGVRRRRPRGPRLTEAGLAMVTARASTQSPTRRRWGAFEPAGCAVRIPPPPQAFLRRDTLGDLLRGRIMAWPVGWPPDWERAAPDDLERAHFLHRHHCVRALVLALRRPRADVSASVVARVLTTWMTAHPVPVGSDGGASPSWETLSTAFRLREWCFVAGAAWRERGFAASRSLMLRSVWEHARHLRDHRGHPGNWRLIEAASLAFAGLLFPEFGEADEWTALGLARLEHEVEAQFQDDGTHVEISPFYHALCAQACLEVRETARMAGLGFPRGIEERLVPSIDALAALVRPDFTWPSINDAGGIGGDHRALFRYAARELGRPDYLWIGTGGRRGAPCVRLECRLPDAGLVVLRTGAERSAHGVLFRCGPPGTSHAHEDVLSLEYWAHGRALLVDPGIVGYGPGADPGRFRAAGAHTMPLVGGCGPGRAGLSRRARVTSPGPLQSGHRDGVGLASGSYSTEEVRVERRIALQQDGALTVHDVFVGARSRRAGPRRDGLAQDRDGAEDSCEHDIAVHWQFVPGVIVVNEERLCVRFSLPGGAGCTLTAWTDAGGLTITGRDGAVARGGRAVAAPSVVFSLRGPLPVALTFLISPWTTTGRRGAVRYDFGPVPQKLTPSRLAWLP